MSNQPSEKTTDADEMRSRLLPLLRDFVEQRRWKLRLQTATALAEKNLSYNTLMAALSPSRSTLAGRKLLKQIVNVLCRDEDGRVDPWLACEAYTRAGRLWVEDVAGDHISNYHDDDKVYVFLPALAFIPERSETREVEARTFLPEEFAEAIVRSASRGVTYVFILQTRRWYSGQVALNDAAKRLACNESWRERVHWIHCQLVDVCAFPFVFVRHDALRHRGFFPILAHGVDGRQELLPYAFVPLDEHSLEATRTFLGPVFELIHDPSKLPSRGFRYQQWEDHR